MQDKRTLLAQNLIQWANNEMHYHPQGKFSSLPPPTLQEMRDLCKGDNINFWNYVIERVRSQRYKPKKKYNRY